MAAWPRVRTSGGHGDGDTGAAVQVVERRCREPHLGHHALVPDGVPPVIVVDDILPGLLCSPCQMLLTLNLLDQFRSAFRRCLRLRQRAQPGAFPPTDQSRDGATATRA